MTRAWRSRSPRPPPSTSTPTSRPTCAASTSCTTPRVGSNAVVAHDVTRGRDPHDHDEGGRQRHRGVGRRRLLDRRTHDVAPDHAGQGRARQRRARPTAGRRRRGLERAGRTSAASSSCPSRTRPSPTSARPTRPTTATLDEPYCTPEDVAYLLDAVNASTSSNLTIERRHRRLGGTSPVARARQRQGGEGAHRRPLAATPGDRLARRRRAHHRRQVDDLSPDGRGHRRRPAALRTRPARRCARRSSVPRRRPVATDVRDSRRTSTNASARTRS